MERHRRRPSTASLTRLEQPSPPGGMQTPYPALVVVWSRVEPNRHGEVLLFPPSPGFEGWLVGRDTPDQDAPWCRANLLRQRPGRSENAGFLRDVHVSHKHLQVRPLPDGTLEVANVGRAPLLHNGVPVRHTVVRPGDLLEIYNLVIFHCSARPLELPTWPSHLSWPEHRFGQADPYQIVGESPQSWEMRRQIVLFAKESGHVLILGASGAGKELAAQAIHHLSPRHARAMVSHNAAAIPETLKDAELFGNLKNYPNPGMLERPGLFGQADGTTFFLDEIGELPEATQVSLLRVLDQGGEYRRLGETEARRSDFRFIGATNRPEDSLRDDVRARFSWTLRLPGLNERREDIPLLVRELMRRMTLRDSYLARRFFEEADRRRALRISPALISGLVLYPYQTHVRELDRLLRRAIAESGPEEQLDLRPETCRELGFLERPRTLEAVLSRLETSLPPPSAGARTTTGEGGGARGALRIDDILNAEERDRLERFREAGFEVGAYMERTGRKKAMAHQHLLVLMLKPLGYNGFDVRGAASLLAGGDEQHARTLQRRLEGYLDKLRERRSKEGDPVLRSRLKETFHGDYRWVEPVLDALATGRIR